MEESLLYHVYRQKQQPQIRVYLNDRQSNRLHILCDDGYDCWIGAEGFRQYYELAVDELIEGGEKMIWFTADHH